MRERSWRDKATIVFVLLGIFVAGATEYGYIRYLRSRFAADVPQAWAQHAYNGSTTLLVPWLIGDNVVYAAKINQIRSFGWPWDAYLRDHRGWHDICQDFASLYVLALLTLPFRHIAVAWHVVAWGLLGLWFVTLFLFFRDLFKTRLLSSGAVAAGALLPLVWADVFPQLGREWGVPNVGKWLYVLINFGFEKRAVEFLRMSSPLLTHWIMMMWFWVCWRLALAAQENRAKPLAIITLGTAVGAMAWVHAFEWSFMLGTFTLFTALCALSPTSRSIARQFAPGVVIALVFSGLSAFLLAQGADPSVILRAGTRFTSEIETHAFFPLVTGLLVTSWALRRAQADIALWLLLLGAAAITGAVALNANLITGFEITRFHYFTQIGFAYSLLLSTGLLAVASRRRDWDQRGMSAAIIMLLVLFFNVKSYAEKNFKIAGMPRDWENAFSWMRTNLPKDASVMTLSANVLQLMPVYTTAKSPVADTAPLLTRVATDDNLHRFAAQLRTLDIDFDRFVADRWDIPNEPALLRRRILGDNPLAELPMERSWWFTLVHWTFVQKPKAAEEAREKIRQSLATVAPLEGEQYAWIQTQDRPLLRQPLENNPAWTKIYESGTVSLFKTGGPLGRSTTESANR